MIVWTEPSVQVIENPEKKLNLKQFKGFEGVRPISLDNLKHTYASPRTSNFLKKLSEVDDGEWRIGDISKKGGGKMPKHNSHQTGNDIDIAIPLKYSGPLESGPAHTLVTQKEVEEGDLVKKDYPFGYPRRTERRGWNYFNATPKTMDFKKTTELLSLLIETKANIVLLDRELIVALHEYILENLEDIPENVREKYGNIREPNDRDGRMRLGRGPEIMHEPHETGPGHKDHFHIRFGSRPKKIVKPVDQDQLPGIITAPGISPRDITLPFPNIVKEGEQPHGYVLSDMSGKTIYSKLNEDFSGQDRKSTRGASMNKPILALLHFIKFKNSPKKQLTENEINGLLSYSERPKGGVKFESNYVNALISQGAGSKLTDEMKSNTELMTRLKAKSEHGQAMQIHKTIIKSYINNKNYAKATLKYFVNRRNTIGRISISEASKILKDLGLDRNAKVLYNSNKQTPKQYHDFMLLLHNTNKLKELGILEEAKKILKYMKRLHRSDRQKFKDRESRRWPKLIKKLKEEGIPVQKIYGKGGAISTDLHYSFVIDDKYLLTIYTLGARQNRKQKQDHDKWFNNKVSKILKPLYVGNIQTPEEERADSTEPEELKESLFQIFDLIDEAMR